MRRVILGLLLLIVFTLCARFILQQQPKSLPPFTAPPNWIEMDLGNFLFYLPPDMKLESAQGIDSEVWRYSNSSIRLTIDWGIYPGDLEAYSDQPEYKEEWIKVDGKTALFCSYRFKEAHTTPAFGDKTYGAAIRFADTETKSMNLTFWAHCKTNSDQETARIIFHSIKFK